MQCIFKTSLVVDTEDAIYPLPLNSTIIRVEYQESVGPCIWYIFDTKDEEKLTDRVFRIIGTGHVIPDEYKYIGSFLMHIFVWHVFEKKG